MTNLIGRKTTGYYTIQNPKFEEEYAAWKSRRGPDSEIPAGRLWTRVDGEIVLVTSNKDGDVSYYVLPDDSGEPIRCARVAVKPQGFQGSLR